MHCEAEMIPMALDQFTDQGLQGLGQAMLANIVCAAVSAERIAEYFACIRASAHHIIRHFPAQGTYLTGGHQRWTPDDSDSFVKLVSHHALHIFQTASDSTGIGVAGGLHEQCHTAFCVLAGKHPQLIPEQGRAALRACDPLQRPDTGAVEITAV